MSVSPPITEPELDSRQLAAWRGLLRSHACLVKALDSELEAAHGLPLTSYEVMVYLQSADEHRMRMCDLAASILLSRSGLTRLVDRLERDGLIERVSCPHDARGSYAQLTDAGREKLRLARDTHLAGVRQHFLAHFGDTELDTLNEFWGRLTPPCC
ncbi:MAG TPA: MarR family transcriptional regulator [Solirubrobacteraceae bacterium]|jgi:DNA-binding MarR family transcriptional regulator|nr:MarR family transcriptional regulator [Solirubrobacteraceae bacterium]